MSDFLSSRNMPTDIWDEILRRHWTFLETEDGMQKLEERKKLETCLKEFLCIVPDDRKFFLPETAHVLKKSIRELDDFSAYNAMIGFESISQYANNLFTKPWRKEFKVIKMYSGFYQHEIKSNLIDAEKLFKAMGYRQLPNQLLVLDGPICPDQVTNVSRDGMAAYVECQIMKHILNGLKALQINCSWSEILNFREAHICSQSQAVKSMVYAIQDRRFRNDKINHENVYATIQPVQQQQQQQQLIQSNCPACMASTGSRNFRQSLQPQLNGSNGSINPCQLHGLNGMSMMQQQQQQQQQMMCGMHGKPQQPLPTTTNNIYNVPQMQMNNCNHGYAQMSHSKSLEHYQEPIPNQGNLLRHSFDHYDCVDSGFAGGRTDSMHGHQNCNYSTYNQHPYNVSGNRYPLPIQISNQLNNQAICGQYQPGMSVNYHSHYLTPSKPNSAVAAVPQPIDTSNCMLHPRNSNSSGGNNFIPMTPSNVRSTGYSTTSNELLMDIDLYNKNIDTFDHIDDDNHTNHLKRNSHDKYSGTNHTDILEQCQKIYDNNSRQLKNTSIMRGGGEPEHLLMDHIVLSSSNDSSSTTKSIPPTSNHKNQDGFGSYESWNFVYKNLEKNGYTKDLGERGDLLVQGLDLDSIKLNSEKRKSRELAESAAQQVQSATSASGIIQPIPLHAVTMTTTSTSASTNIKDADLTAIGKISSKSLERNNDKANIKTTTTNISRKPLITKANGHISSGRSKDLNNGGSEIVNGGGSISRTPKSKSSHRNSLNNNQDSIEKKTTSGWDCSFCTYINPETEKICEMCSKTKDFSIDGGTSVSSSSKPID